jgi:ABC-type dipeptide/oligopeptide/nickel transport system ATPase component
MKPLIELDRLSIGYDTPDGRVSAVKDVSLSIHPREIYALVGESGCGKTTLAASIMRLVAPPGRVTSGRVLFDGVDLTELTDQEIVRYRGKRIGMIFQNPLDSFNPVLSIGSQISEAIMIDRVPGRTR